MNSAIRYRLICWMYFISLMHFFGGVLFAWFSDLGGLDGYHNLVTEQFAGLTTHTRELHIWWLSLFGATLQNIAIFMGVLTYVGSKERRPLIWMWMIIGVIVWAPQDIWISLKINLWAHVWLDIIALLIMVPPLLGLWWIDKKPGK